MLEHLFGSKTRLKVLRTFFQNPAKAFFVRELTRILDTQINAVRREIDLLIDAGLVKEVQYQPPSSDTKGGRELRKYYALNTESILFPELHALLLKGQALGEQVLVNALKDKGGVVKLLLLTGKFTNDKRAETDILLVGDIDERAVARLIEQHEKESGAPVRYTVLTTKEFADRRYIMDKFLYSLFECKHVKAVDLLEAEARRPS